MDLTLRPLPKLTGLKWAPSERKHYWALSAPCADNGRRLVMAIWSTQYDLSPGPAFSLWMGNGLVICDYTTIVYQIKLYFVFVYLILNWYLGRRKIRSISIEMMLILSLFLFSLTLKNWNI